MFQPEDEAHSSSYEGIHEEVIKVNKETEAFTAVAFLVRNIVFSWESSHFDMNENSFLFCLVWYKLHIPHLNTLFRHPHYSQYDYKIRLFIPYAGLELVQFFAKITHKSLAVHKIMEVMHIVYAKIGTLSQHIGNLQTM